MSSIAKRFRPGFSTVRVVGLLSLGTIAASAQVLSYPDFSVTTGLSINGTASTTRTSDGNVLRLTPAACCSAGSAFAAQPVPFQLSADTFSTFFQFRITNPGGLAPADGIAFIIREKGLPNLGITGGTTGYDGIGHSISIRFDTYRNEGEINNNRVNIQTDGTKENLVSRTPLGVANCSLPAGIVGCMSNGDVWSVWIDYDGSHVHVALADSSTTRPADLIDLPLSLPALLNYAPDAAVGLSAGTGGGFENHDILNWVYFSTFNPTPTGTAQLMPAKLIAPPAVVSQAIVRSGPGPR